MRFSDIAHQEFVIPGLTVGDILHAYETGRVASGSLGSIHRS